MDDEACCCSYSPPTVVVDNVMLEVLLIFDFNRHRSLEID
jgi:hypothetical protein